MLQFRTFLLMLSSTAIVLIANSRPLNKRSSSGHHEDEAGMQMTNAMMYLMRYGYMDHAMEEAGARSANLLSPDSVKNSIMDFQKFANIPVTGVLDAETEKMMKMPRCGVKDNVSMNQHHNNNETHVRRKRYALQGSRWRVKNLTYKISRYPSTRRLDRDDVDDEIKKALDVWTQYTDLTFTQKRTGRVHIDVRFEEREHGDGDPFDGQGGTLAHAFFPVFGGDAHFDDDEFWTRGTFTGTNLLQTAAHEFGHSLGLSHSDSSTALMAPFYRGFEAKVRLAKDDINGIQELYGEKSGSDNAGGNEIDSDEDDDDDEDERSEENDDEELCNDASIDAIVTLEDKVTYTFKGGQYWKLTDDSIADGYPRSISRDWDGLPANVDAAFTWTNGKTYFFKGSKYYRFTRGRKMDNGYPKEIRKGFEGIPNDVDAAFVWSGNEKIYFFKGSKFYKFDPEKSPPVGETYPKPISNWEGIPNNVDDAVRYSNGYTYFFKDGQYWRFNDDRFKVDTAEPDFPRPAGFWWFGCSSINQGISTTTTEANSYNDGGGGWLFGWLGDQPRADVPITVDEDYDNNRGVNEDERNKDEGGVKFPGEQNQSLKMNKANEGTSNVYNAVSPINLLLPILVTALFSKA